MQELQLGSVFKNVDRTTLQSCTYSSVSTRTKTALLCSKFSCAAVVSEGSSSYEEISSVQSPLNRSGLSLLFHKTRNNCTVRHQCKTDTRGIRLARLPPYSRKINLIRPWHCVIALGPAGLFITFSQTQHF